jgi:hypothetical protein
MENFTNILKQFSSGQRILVLILLLVFTSITSVVTTYLTSDYNSCGEIVKENRELLQDYVLISQMIREQQMPPAESTMILDTMPRSSSPVTIIEVQDNGMLDSILAITEKHIK